MKRLDQQRIAPWIFISPFFILFCIFGIFPILYLLFLSFQSWGGGVRAPVFVGFDNYVKLISGADPFFWRTVGATSWLLVFGSLTQHIIAIPLAILLNNKLLKGRDFLKTAYFLPYITSTVSIALIFQVIFSPNAGWINYIIELITGPGVKKIDWLASATYLPWTVASMVNWKYIGWNTLLYVAGLQAISEELYESADIDGASTFDKHWNITIPMLRPIIFYAVAISIIGGMQLFVEPFVITRGWENMGGGGNSVFTVAFYILWLLIRGAKLGVGAAVSWLLFIIIITLTLVYQRLMNLEAAEGEPAQKKKKIANNGSVAENYK